MKFRLVFIFYTFMVALMDKYFILIIKSWFFLINILRTNYLVCLIEAYMGLF